MIPGLHKIAAMILCTCEVGFSAMSATALIPLTCYTHPNKLKSLLKYPNVICGSDTHGAMLAVGLCLLILGVFGFLALCTYGAYMVPTWSACEKHGRVRAFRFLVFRFRLETWPLFLYVVISTFPGTIAHEGAVFGFRVFVNMFQLPLSRHTSGQLVVWSSTVDPWSFDCPSHRAGHRLPGGADGLGDLHPSEFFGVSGSGVAMEGAVLNITRTGIETLQNWMFMVGFTTLYIYIYIPGASNVLLFLGRPAFLDRSNFCWS